MAIKSLSEEQVRTMSPEEKDRWWLENVYQGNVPQMTFRAVVCGFLLGGLLSVTNLYIGAKTGWSLGVAITSVILAFVLFKVLSQLGLGRNYHVLENNILQSVACSAGYMNGPLFASMAAYMVITNTVVPWWQMIMWLLGLATLGVLFAFPLKRRFINEEQLPFPEGRAAGVVLDTLHSEDSSQSVLSAKLLVLASFIAGLMKLMTSEAVMEKIHLARITIPEMLDGWYYELCKNNDWQPFMIRNVPLQELTVRPELDIAMFGAGGLMGIRTGAALLIGAVINYCFLAPWMIEQGDIVGVAGADGVMHYGFRPIVMWSLWGGVSMMTTASLVSFFAKPQVLVSAFSRIFAGKKRSEDCLKNIEFPMWLSFIGIPLVGAYVVWIAHWFFGVQWWMGAIAIPMVFVFTLIGVNSTALTSITPTGALGKLTQLAYGAIAPGNITTNIATAGISAEVAGGASNLIQNIKPGYMLGAKPRLQAIAHVIGAVSGALFSVAVFYWLFLPDDLSTLISDDHPYPAAIAWKAVAEVLTQGLGMLPQSAIWAAAIGAVIGIILEILRIVTKNKFPLSPVGLGLGFIIPFTTCFAMFMGAFVFWLIGKIWHKREARMNEIVVQNQESICAGIITGAALIGIVVMALDVLVFKAAH